MNDCQKTVPLWEKYALTMAEASRYFNIGEKKLRIIVSRNMDADFVFTNGTKVLVKRRLFEQFMDNTSSI